MCLSTLALYIGALNAARFLHNDLLNTTIRAPTSTFFDVTPVGRILNRFAKDIDTADNDLPATLRAFVACLFGVYKDIFFCLFFRPGIFWWWKFFY
jgi:ATP-binding cassette, subfamily C (CFTR/MRP), member 1